jgi:cob(I)alamin adenosyltransferase
MKIYTRTGDEGTAALVGGSRVAKFHRRLAAFGSVDELNAQFGVCRAAAPPPEIDAVVERLQHEMFALGAELASPDPTAAGTELLAADDVERIEREIDRFEETLPPLREFILPGGTPAAAALHVARAICRRAERDVVALAEEAKLRPLLLAYLNRVGDLLFVLARAANRAAGTPDLPWVKPRRDEG